MHTEVEYQSSVDVRVRQAPLVNMLLYVSRTLLRKWIYILVQIYTRRGWQCTCGHTHHVQLTMEYLSIGVSLKLTLPTLQRERLTEELRPPQSLAT